MDDIYSNFDYYEQWSDNGWIYKEYDKRKEPAPSKRTQAFEKKHGIRVKYIKDRLDITLKRHRINRICHIAFGYKDEMHIPKDQFLIDALSLTVNQAKIQKLYNELYNEKLSRQNIDQYVKKLIQDRDEYIENYKRYIGSTQVQKMDQWRSGDLISEASCYVHMAQAGRDLDNAFLTVYEEDCLRDGIELPKGWLEQTRKTRNLAASC